MLLRLLLSTSDKQVTVCYSFSSSGILDDDTFDEYAVVIYMAVLRRKVSSYSCQKGCRYLYFAAQPDSSGIGSVHLIHAYLQR